MKSPFFAWPAILLSLVFFSCNTSKGGLFGKKSPHEKYSGRLAEAGLEKTKLGSLWLAAAEKALQKPVSIELPYKETGFFPSEDPSASAYIFSIKMGEKLAVNLMVKPANVNVFADLWELSPDGNRSLISSTDSSSFSIQHEAEKNTSFILRIQPELLNPVEYTVTINTGPSLVFPVRQSDNPKVSSFWGADRDGGSRSHEGIDIFAKKGTPAIASAEGRVTRVNENNLGGKVVFLRPKGKSFSLYYAHLDSQLVSEGQQVKEGDVIGLIGNTGNARTTPAHLHFGIYSSSGAVDPYPFVNQSRAAAKQIAGSVNTLNQYARTKATASIQSSPGNASSIVKIPANQPVKVIAATSDLYKVQTTEGVEGFLKYNAITAEPLQTRKLNKEAPLFEKPNVNSPMKRVINANASVAVLGTFENFDLVMHEQTRGWIQTQNQ